MPRIPTHLRTTNPEENKAKARKRYRSALIAAVVLTFSTGTVALAAGLGVFTPSNAQTPTASPPPAAAPRAPSQITSLDDLYAELDQIISGSRSGDRNEHEEHEEQRRGLKRWSHLAKTSTLTGGRHRPRALRAQSSPSWTQWRC